MGVDVPEVRPARQRPAAKKQGQQAVKTPDPLPAARAPEIVKSASTLEELHARIRDFDAGEISDHARQAVIYRGNPAARIMIIGEAPGRDEDIQGRPFVGRSGQLLDRILGSIGLSEDTVYITNVVFWRPPNNRNPNPGEITECLPFTQRHIEIINPDIIVLVGAVSFSALTGRTGIMKNRGGWITLPANGRDIPALPIYHPAFLLRQPALKKDTWRDMLSLKARIGTVPDRTG